MLSLQKDHITDLYVLIDDAIPKISSPLGGRPTLMNNSELLTALVWNTLTVRQKTLKDIHAWLMLYHRRDFPKIPKYSAFVDHCHRVMPLFIELIHLLLQNEAPLRFMDSTMVPVCKNVRSDSHKVARNTAASGKNHQGWHYGFKLHASIDAHGRLSGIALTPANVFDAHAMGTLLNEHARIAVGDTSYGASVMRSIIWRKYGTIVIAPPHPKQNKKIMAEWQHFLLTMRPKIESVFGYLKEHLHLVTSFPRSVNGYILHYLRILLGYQILTF